MDLSPRQVEDIQEIEKQISENGEAGPKVLSQTEVQDKSTLIQLLAALGITISATAAIVIILLSPFSAKKPASPVVVTTGTIYLPNLTVKTEYVNPFDTTSQYDNPFIASRNPFNTTQ